MGEPIITLENVSFKNDNYTVLENVNVEIEIDRFTAVIGKSGAGKSTLIKIMAGLVEPTAGNVKIYGVDMTDYDSPQVNRIKKKIGFSFQDSALLSNLSIRENLALPLKYYFKNMTEKRMTERIEELLDKVSLLDSQFLRPAQLSFGEQKLASIIRSMTTNPEILFLDEPLTSIDATLSKKVLALIKDYSKNEWTTVIIVTHSPELIINEAKKIIVIEDKVIKLETTPKELLAGGRVDGMEIVNDMFENYF